MSPSDTSGEWTFVQAQLHDSFRGHLCHVTPIVPLLTLLGRSLWPTLVSMLAIRVNCRGVKTPWAPRFLKLFESANRKLRHWGTPPVVCYTLGFNLENICYKAYALCKIETPFLVGLTLSLNYHGKSQNSIMKTICYPRLVPCNLTWLRHSFVSRRQKLKKESQIKNPVCREKTVSIISNSMMDE